MIRTRIVTGSKGGGMEGETSGGRTRSTKSTRRRRGGRMIRMNSMEREERREGIASIVLMEGGGSNCRERTGKARTGGGGRG